MRSMRRIRNMAFLGLLVTLVWAGSINLRAESGGYFCGYGYCMLTYQNCSGNWAYQSLAYPGSCLIVYEPGEASGEGETCYIDMQDGGGYHWVWEQGGSCGGNYCFACAPD